MTWKKKRSLYWSYSTLFVCLERVKCCNGLLFFFSLFLRFLKTSMRVALPPLFLLISSKVINVVYSAELCAFPLFVCGKRICCHTWFLWMCWGLKVFFFPLSLNNLSTFTLLKWTLAASDLSNLQALLYPPHSHVFCSTNHSYITNKLQPFSECLCWWV